MLSFGFLENWLKFPCYVQSSMPQIFFNGEILVLKVSCCRVNTPVLNNNTEAIVNVNVKTLYLVTFENLMNLVKVQDIRRLSMSTSLT